jgi:general secretion pathway protein C
VSPFSPDALQVSDAPDTGSAALLRVGGAPAEKPVPPPRESALARTLLAQPHFEAEKLVGFEVHPGARRQAFEQLGLVPGDVVRFVGGEPITGEAQWRAIVEPLGRGERVNVTVSRQGTLVHLALDGAIFSSGSRNANEG